MKLFSDKYKLHWNIAAVFVCFILVAFGTYNYLKGENSNWNLFRTLVFAVLGLVKLIDVTLILRKKSITDVRDQ